MRVDCRRLRRRGTVLVAAAVAVTATLITRAAAADARPTPPGAAAAEPEPRCHRDQDLACTLVRETPEGVWVWTERFRAAAPGNTGWTLAVGAGPVSPVPVAQFVAPASPPARPTPNGSPILE